MNNLRARIEKLEQATAPLEPIRIFRSIMVEGSTTEIDHIIERLPGGGCRLVTNTDEGES